MQIKKFTKEAFIYLVHRISLNYERQSQLMILCCHMQHLIALSEKKVSETWAYFFFGRISEVSCAFRCFFCIFEIQVPYLRLLNVLAFNDCSVSGVKFLSVVMALQSLLPGYNNV